MDRIAIFTGNAHRSLAEAVCASWHPPGSMSGTPMVLGQALVTSFSDGETRVQIEQNVRGVDVYVVQPTCAPTNPNLMELLVMVDALRRASAGSITAVIPYYGYARQDRKVAPRTPITSSLVAHLLETAGIDRMISVDLHAAQIQGFFKVPVDNLYARPALLPHLVKHYSGAVIVSPDAGGFERARSYSKEIPGSTVAAIDKRRAKPNESEVMHVIGDVDGKRCLILDDMIDTAGTLLKGAEALRKHGAVSVGAAAAHGVFSGPATTNLLAALGVGLDHIARPGTRVLDEVIVTDTIPLRPELQGHVTVASVAPLLADAIKRVHSNDSVSSLFQ